MIEVGYFSFCFAFLLSIYSLIVSILSLFKPYLSLISSARNAIISVFLCVLLSSVILWNSIFFHDFSVRYVFLHSAINMPPVYLFTSFWSALEGSHLLWTLLLSLVCSISLLTVRKNNLIYAPALCLTYSVVLSFMLILNLTVSAPLTRIFQLETFGRGMNALLQNPYMAIHPPMLFSGYSLLIVPFAYSLGALIQGYLTGDALIAIKRTSLVAWGFLTVAIFLGGRWAYFELGWGGYWGWDPVENSSFMPWLALTASLHGFLIYTRTKRLPRLSLFLAMLSFILTFQGTFLTRSGIISSVHSFAESNIGPAYLTWILFLLFSTCILIIIRGNLIEGAARSNEWTFSKETSLLFAIFFFLFFLTLVFVGTVLPLIVESIRGVKISIQQPFFNSFMPWIGLGLVSFLGIGNLLKWRSGKIEDPISCLLFPFFWSIIITICLIIQKDLSMRTAFSYFMVFWTAFILIMDLVFKLKEFHWNGLDFLKHKRPYLGALIVHLGFLMAVLGFTGNYQTNSAEVNLNLGQSTQFYGYNIKNNGLKYESQYNVQRVIANLFATNSDTNDTALITPSRNKFTNNEQWFNEIGVYSTFWHDVYIVLSSFDLKTESVSLKMNFNPTVKFVWTSLVVAIFGILVSLSHQFMSFNSGSTEGKKNKWKQAASSAFIVGLILICSVFAYSGIAHAQVTGKNEAVSLLTDGSGNGSQLSGKTLKSGDQIPMQTNSKLVDIAKELRCPTCLGMSILESGTPQSMAMRSEIIEQLNEGKSKKEIIQYFKSRYGEWILREPDAHSWTGFIIWATLIFLLICGPITLIYQIKKSQKMKIIKRQKYRHDIEELLTKMKKEGNS